MPSQRTQGLEVSAGFIVTLSSIFLSIYLPASDYGLFLSDEDPRKGIWLEAGRTLDYYMLRNGVCRRSRFLFFHHLVSEPSVEASTSVLQRKEEAQQFILIQGHLSSSVDVTYCVRAIQVVAPAAKFLKPHRVMKADWGEYLKLFLRAIVGVGRYEIRQRVFLYVGSVLVIGDRK